MIRKIIIFSQNNGAGFNFMKSASNLRLSYMLRSVGYEVKQIHNCLSFKPEEIKWIVENFTQGEPAVACISSSFINTMFRKNVVNMESGKTQTGYRWGLETFTFFLKTFFVLKSMNVSIMLGGWEVEKVKFQSKDSRYSWGFDVLDKFVDLYVIGNNVDVIQKFTKNESIDYENINGSRIATSAEVLDFSDCASTPLTDDFVLEDESLSTEIAAGCIFSCQFCNYAALGKKKTEYMRTYESLERELITNYENSKTRMYLLTDNIMNDYEEKLKFLIKIREKTGIDIRWTGYVRLDTIKKKEQAQLLLESGIAGATFGIESLKKEAGPSIGKMTDKNKLIQSLEIFRDVIGDNCITTASFIAGLPTESLDELMQTREWLISKEGRHYIDQHTFTGLLLYPGNENKNDINVGRNDPFKEYERTKMPWKWKSPWGTSEQFMNTAYYINQSETMTTSAFALPFLHNVGLKVENAVKLVRTANSETQKQIVNKLQPIYNQKIETYKSKMLGK